MLIPDDVARIARHLGYTDVMEFSRENLLASPGAIVLRDNQQVRIPTLVPQRGADGACKFLQNDLCTIHSVSPYGCAFFSEHEPRTVGDKKSILGLIHITRDHQTNGRYSRIWSMLDSTNLYLTPSHYLALPNQQQSQNTAVPNNWLQRSTIFKPPHAFTSKRSFNRSKDQHVSPNRS